MSSVDILKIKKLFQEKRFPEIIFEIESLTTDQNRSSALHNLLGVCRVAQKARSDRDIEYAFKLFIWFGIYKNFKNLNFYKFLFYF